MMKDWNGAKIRVFDDDFLAGCVADDWGYLWFSECVDEFEEELVFGGVDSLCDDVSV